MAAINFPDTPAVNDTHTEAGITWVWTGIAWEIEPSPPTFTIIVDESDVEVAQREKLKFVGHDVIDEPLDNRVVVNRQHESQYRFEIVTTIDQDIWLNDSTIFKIVKSIGVDTAEYRIGVGAWVPITFTGDTWTGTLNITANQVLSWRITYSIGFITAGLIVQHKRTL
jgi:hypothetical protein